MSDYIYIHRRAIWSLRGVVAPLLFALGMPLSIPNAHAAGPLTFLCAPAIGPSAVGMSWSTTCTASGGTPPYVFSSSGVPAWITTSTSTTTIRAVGTPTAAGGYAFSLDVVDSGSPAKSTGNPFLGSTISPPPLAISGPLVLSSGMVGKAYGPIDYSATGGVPPYTWKASGLPSGLSIDSGSGSITGTPASAGTYSANVTVTDSSYPSAVSVSRLYSLSIAPGLGLSCVINLGTTGTAYSSVCSASGGIQPYIFSAAGLPAGLSIDASRGIISGTPIAAGTFQVTAAVTDSSPQPLSNSLQIAFTILQGGVTVACKPAPGTVGSTYSASCSASGGIPPYSWTASGLPSGLSMNPGTGAIFGTPSAAGSFLATTSATDSSTTKQTGALQFTLVIAPSPLLQTCNFSSATLNAAYSASCTASGGTPPYSWTANGLPAGLTIGPGTGAVTGTPSVSGAFAVTITVTDNSTPRQNNSHQLTITVGSSTLSITCTQTNGTVGVPFSGSCTASGGAAPYNLDVLGLPPGLMIDRATGAITGTPTAIGNYSFTASITDSSTPAAQSASQQFTIVIQPASLTVKCPVGQGKVGVSYTLSCTATGGNPPYGWAGNGLPPGLQIDSSSGLISGIPNAAGSFTVQVQVVDNSQPANQKGQIQFSIVIQPGPLTIDCGAPPQGIVGHSFSFGCAANGGTTPYQWQASGLPAGFSINPVSGAISGTPTASGVSQVTATVNDSSLEVQTASQQFTIAVAPPPVSAIITQNNTNSLPNQTNVTVTFAGPVARYTGQLSLSFTPDPIVSNVPAGYHDPSAGFPAFGSNTSSLEMPFTVSESSATQMSTPLAVGTVAGTWTVALTQLNDPNGLSALAGTNPPITVRVNPSVPVIQPGSVQITQLSSTGFIVQLTASSNTRELTSATFMFAASSGANLQGATVTLPFNGLDQTSWFATQASLTLGGNFTLKVPFALSGSSSALGGVSVTLANSEGTSSATAQ